MKIKILGPSPPSIGLEKVGIYLRKKIALLDSDGEIMILVALLDKEILSVVSKKIQKIKGKTKIIVGIELGTSKDSLKALYKLLGSNAFVYYNPKGSFFHPKLYIVKISKKEGVIIVGSSNFTPAGFFENLEVNVALELDFENSTDKEIFDSLVQVFNKTLTLKGINPLSQDLINRLSKLKLPKTDIHQIKKRMYKLSDIFKSDKIDFEGFTNFVMTLSYNDVSGKRGDKYIRIPKHAVEKNTTFWGWDYKFTPSEIAGFPERCIEIIYDKHTYKHRMYYVSKVSEMRLVFPQIYTLGKDFVGSILWIAKTDEKYKAKLIGKDHRDYEKFLSYCTETSPKGQSSVPKKWGYFYST